jgi:prepilin-type N-terminal cleavage/methylation domain-containing protein
MGGMLRNKLRIKGEEGFTLIEVLMAVMLLAICAVGMFSLLAPASRLILQTSIKENAMNLATAQLEYIKNLPYDRDTAPPTYELEDLSSQYSGFTPSIIAERIHPVDSTETGDEGVQKITITIAYEGDTITTLEGYKADW